MKTPMTIEDILRRSPYKDIIKLTHRFQHKEGGLRLIHYRWALVVNHDNIKRDDYVQQMTEFFSPQYTPERWKKERKTANQIEVQSNVKVAQKENINSGAFLESNPPQVPEVDNFSLEHLYQIGEVTPGCIQGRRARQNLVNFVMKLSDPKGYNILEKKRDGDGVPRYKIRDYGRILIFLQRDQIKDIVDRLLEKDARGEMKKLDSFAKQIYYQYNRAHGENNDCSTKGTMTTQ